MPRPSALAKASLAANLLARLEAGLSQDALAALIGSNQQTISKLEDADYEGHSLTMLRKIADALQQELVVQFVPAEHV